MPDDAENAVYDDPAVFAAYQDMRQLAGRLNEVVEQPAILSLLPDIKDLRVADLGCGTGAMCRWLRTMGARSVTGIDNSARMLEAARSENGHAGIIYLNQSLETLDDLGAEHFDLIISSLALHYVGDFCGLVRNVHRALAHGGSFVFSVEHPIVTCDRREWSAGADGVRQHWPVDRYMEEGARQVRWLDLDVIRHHRTIGSYLNPLLDSGFVLKTVLEPAPDDAAIRQWPRLADQRRRPPFLVVRADKS